MSDAPNAAPGDRGIELGDTVRARVAVGLVVALCMGLGWQLRWILDDAFISYRYAWNLVHGHGLVFNPGELPHVEGYTNFLWTVLMAAPIGLGLDPIRPAFAMSLVCGGVTLLMTARLARSMVSHEESGILAALLLGLNFSFLCFMTSGLETALQTCLITAFILHAVAYGSGETSTARAIGISLCGAGALLTRLDSAVPIMVTGVWLVLRLRSEGRGGRVWISRLAGLVLPGGAILCVWLIWKLKYYGGVLPNTWYAREVGLPLSLRWSRGLRFLAGFLRQYAYWPVLVVVAAKLKLWRQPAMLLLTTMLLAWFGYVVHSGADYMEYRFVVPMLPVLCIVTIVALSSIQRLAAPIVVAGLVAASAAHGWKNPDTPIGHGRLGQGLLEEKQFPEAENVWTDLRDLVRSYPGGDEVLWTLPAIGMSGYYSQFRIVDLHGLTDPWVARHGLVRNQRPGHDKYAPLSYLEQRGVALAHCWENPCYWYYFYSADELGRRQLVELGGLLFLSITPNPTIDQAVTEHGHRFWLPPPEACVEQDGARRAAEMLAQP